MKNIKYIGCFFDTDTVRKNAEKQCKERLYRVIKHAHITFVYRPQMIPYELFGESVTIRVTGYGCDGENEAFLVEFEEMSKELFALAEHIKKPHITISVSKDGESVNSSKLTFHEIEPFCITGTFGGMDEEGNIHTK